MRWRRRRRRRRRRKKGADVGERGVMMGGLRCVGGE
jgi:hypothetical protein